MFRFFIQPEWLISLNGGEPVSLPVILHLLEEIERSGNLVAACKARRLSYRHGWGLLRQFEAGFGVPLLETSRRKGTQLTPFAEKLLWANKRIMARLTPTLETLTSELENEIEASLSDKKPVLHVHAGYGFAVAELVKKLQTKHSSVDVRYGGCTESLAALGMGSCDVAGVSVPIGELRDMVVRQYLPLLKPGQQGMVHLAVRTQGLITAPGNPKNITTITDLTRPDVRMVNRPLGSGTRTLLDYLIQQSRLDVSQIQGYGNSEYTHSAVAAYIASGMADAGFGIEAGARQFGLHFHPIATEDYYIIFNLSIQEHVALQDMLEIMQDAEFRAVINKIAGYMCVYPAQVMSVEAGLRLGSVG